MTTVYTRIPAAELRRAFDDAGIETDRECRDCRALLPSTHFSTHAGGRRRFVCRSCVAIRRATRDDASPLRRATER